MIILSPAVNDLLPQPRKTRTMAAIGIINDQFAACLGTNTFLTSRREATDVQSLGKPLRCAEHLPICVLAGIPIVRTGGGAQERPFLS